MTYYCEECIHKNNCEIINENRKMICAFFEKCRLKGQYVKPRWRRTTDKYKNTVNCCTCLFYETINCPKYKSINNDTT